LGLGIAPVSLSAIAIMELTVVQIGDVTSNGNQIVKLNHKVDIEKDTVIGVKRQQQSTTYYMAIKDGTVKVAVDEVVDLNVDEFKVTPRPYVNEDGSLPLDSDGEEICDENGDPLMLKWLSLQ
jgi:hypothetical protein